MVATTRDLDEYALDTATCFGRAERGANTWDVPSLACYATQARYAHRVRKTARSFNGMHRRGSRKKYL